MADAFISCVEEEEPLAAAVAEALKARGFTTWYFLRHGVPGASRQIQVDEAIAEASCVVLLVSEASLGSAAAAREALLAHRSGKKILPILVDLTPEQFFGAGREWIRALGDLAPMRWDDNVEAVADAIVGRFDALAVHSLVTRVSRHGPVEFAAEPRRAGEPPAGRSLRVAGRIARHAIAPHRELRVAFSAILRVSRGDRYLLVRNLHRRESFAPIGGVYKYRAPAVATLDALGFRPQSVGPGDDMVRDLRGFLPVKNLKGILGWFNDGRDRESGPECLTREFREEMEESGIWTATDDPKRMLVRHVRRIEEGPEPIPGQQYVQYRIFDVYEILESPAALKLQARLFGIAQGPGDLIAVSSAQIVAGRAGRGDLIGHHAAYLFGTKRHRPEIPIFLDNGVRQGERNN